MTETEFLKNFPSLRGKIIRMWATSLEFPDNGRRKCELSTKSKWLCEYINEEKRAYGNDFVHSSIISEALIDKSIVERDYIKKEKVKEIISKIKVGARIAGTKSDECYNMELEHVIVAYKETLKKELGI